MAIGCVARAAVVTPDGPHSEPYNARPAVANEFATAYENECRLGRPYDAEKTTHVQCEFVLAVPVRPAG